MAEKDTGYADQAGPLGLPVVNDEATVPIAERHGFLPFPTNAWDRFFISGVCLVAIHLLWLRFIEGYIPLWGAMIVSLALGVYIFKRG